MRGFISGLGIVALIAAIGWLAMFGTKKPCEALQVEATRMGAEKKDAALASALLEGLRHGSLSQLECGVVSVRIKVFGQSGVTVLRSSPGPTKK